MIVREAEDFLVQQIVEEAQAEGKPLSGLERRMLYFTETSNAIENPVALNDEFESQYGTAQYEKRMSNLMGRAYQRLKQGNTEELREWQAAIRVLEKGDHYILVFWQTAPKSTHPKRDALLPYGIGVLIALFFFAVMVLKRCLGK